MHKRVYAGALACPRNEREIIMVHVILVTNERKLKPIVYFCRNNNIRCVIVFLQSSSGYKIVA